jgi:hypothetical protein
MAFTFQVADSYGNPIKDFQPAGVQIHGDPIENRVHGILGFLHVLVTPGIQIIGSNSYQTSSSEQNHGFSKRPSSN